MRRLLLLLVVALPLGCPAITSAGLVWEDKAWTVTSSIDKEGYSRASVVTGDPSADELTGFLSAFNDHDGSSGPVGASSYLEVSRSFQVVNKQELVTLELPISGTLSGFSYLWFGSFAATLEVDFEIDGPSSTALGPVFDCWNINQYEDYQSFSVTLAAEGVLEPGEVYTIQGSFELLAYTISGPTQVRGDITVGVNLTPTPAPEPTSLQLLVLGSGIWLGIARLRRNGHLRTEMGIRGAR